LEEQYQIYDENPMEQDIPLKRKECHRRGDIKLQAVYGRDSYS